MNRPLTDKEKALVEWMLLNGTEEAPNYLTQLQSATVVGGCPCGCASIDFSIDGKPRPVGGMNVVSDYVYESKNGLAGAFVFVSDGLLAGLEIYGLACDAPSTLPAIDSLRPIETELWNNGCSDSGGASRTP